MAPTIRAALLLCSRISSCYSTTVCPCGWISDLIRGHIALTKHNLLLLMCEVPSSCLRLSWVHTSQLCVLWTEVTEILVTQRRRWQSWAEVGKTVGKIILKALRIYTRRLICYIILGRPALQHHLQRCPGYQLDKTRRVPAFVVFCRVCVCTEWLDNRLQLCACLNQENTGCVPALRSVWGPLRQASGFRLHVPNWLLLLG